MIPIRIITSVTLGLAATAWLISGVGRRIVRSKTNSLATQILRLAAARTLGSAASKPAVQQQFARVTPVCSTVAVNQLSTMHGSLPV